MEMINIDLACKAELESLKIAICDIPELGNEYGCQAYGVFGLWCRLRGWTDTENNEVKAMREYMLGIARFGEAMEKKAVK